MYNKISTTKNNNSNTDMDRKRMKDVILYILLPNRFISVLSWFNLTWKDSEPEARWMEIASQQNVVKQ